MGIRIGWLVQDKVLLCESTGDIDATDYQAHMAELGIVLTASEEPIHIVFDVTRTTSLPGLKTQTESAGHPNLNWVIRVGKNPMTVPFISSIVLHASKKPFRFADSVDAAIQILCRVDQPLADAKWIAQESIDWHETGASLLAT